MPIPNADSAFVPPQKLRDYLLNSSHPVGGPKARWFLALGYHPSRGERLEADLLEIVHNRSDYVEEQTRFGMKYVVRGELDSPNGTRADVQTVWIVETNMTAPRLVTAYPDEYIEHD
ncbi:MAG: DUF6883 domain-containing protein [Planctomycetaceae bacterium]